jgi:hypothetical protein
MKRVEGEAATTRGLSADNIEGLDLAAEATESRPTEDSDRQAELDGSEGLPN